MFGLARIFDEAHGAQTMMIKRVINAD